jgi:polysaccharide biosynthesis protein PslG
MRRSIRGLAATGSLFLCLIALLCPAVAPALSPVARGSSLVPLAGVNIDGLSYGSQPAQADHEIALAKALGAKVVRLEVPWSVMEPLQAGGVEPGPLAFTDRLTADAAADGIRVIMMVESTPCWASSAPASLARACTPGRASRANGWPPREPSDYAAFVAYLAQRYGTQLAAIEIWNEPDQANELYFAGPEKPARYAALLRAAYPAIKQANPNVLVLGGAIVGVNGEFLRQLYAAGIKGYYDGLAVHFYTLTVAALRYTHQVQLANGDSKPLYLDEFGFSSCWPQQKLQQEQGCVSKQLQGPDLVSLFHQITRLPYVAALVVYKLQDAPMENFGVFTVAGARKPAFAALAQALASPLGAPGPVTLKLRREGRHVLASGSAPPGDYVQLEAQSARDVRYRTVFAVNRFNDYSIALPRVLGTSGLQVRVFQYQDSPAGATQRSI